MAVRIADAAIPVVAGVHPGFMRTRIAAGIAEARSPISIIVAASIAAHIADTIGGFPFISPGMIAAILTDRAFPRALFGVYPAGRMIALKAASRADALPSFIIIPLMLTGHAAVLALVILVITVDMMLAYGFTPGARAVFRVKVMRNLAMTDMAAAVFILVIVSRAMRALIAASRAFAPLVIGVLGIAAADLAGGVLVTIVTSTVLTPLVAQVAQAFHTRGGIGIAVRALVAASRAQARFIERMASCFAAGLAVALFIGIVTGTVIAVDVAD